MTILGAAFVLVGIILLIRSPRIKLDPGRGKVRGIGGPILIILGLLLLFGVLP
jgi:hypothetical protein